MAKHKPRPKPEEPVQETLEKPISGQTPEPKSTGKKPNRTKEALNLWIPKPLHAALRAYINSFQYKPTATEVGIEALQEFLQERGFWPPPAAS